MISANERVGFRERITQQRILFTSLVNGAAVIASCQAISVPLGIARQDTIYFFCLRSTVHNCAGCTERANIFALISISPTRLHKYATNNTSFFSFSLTYKVLTTSQPTYLSKLVQSPRSTRSSSVVFISRPPTSSSLKITNRSFRHTAPHLWNELRHSFREPYPHLGLSPSHHHTQVGSTLSSPSFSQSITLSRFTSDS